MQCDSPQCSPPVNKPVKDQDNERINLIYAVFHDFNILATNIAHFG